MNTLLKLKIPLNEIPSNYDFSFFQNLISLKSIDLSLVNFSGNSFLNFIKKIGKLKHLSKMNWEQIIFSLIINRKIITEKSEEIIAMILSNLHLEYMKLGFDYIYDQVFDCLMEILARSKTIIHLSIYFNKISEVNFNKFCEYISSTKILKKLRFTIKELTYIDKISSLLTLNSTIKELSLINIDYSHHYKLLDTLIRENKSISILDLTNCSIYGGTYLVPSLSKNEQIQKIILLKNKIPEEIIREIMKITNKEVVIERKKIEKIKEAEINEQNKREKFQVIANQKEVKKIKTTKVKSTNKKNIN